jgi:prolipoprotein diacylglyceryltransferase
MNEGLRPLFWGLAFWGGVLGIDSLHMVSFVALEKLRFTSFAKMAAGD